MVNLYFYVIGSLLALSALGVRIDDCNLAYWKPRLMGTVLVDDMHPAPRRITSKKLSFWDKLPKHKRVIGPHTEMKDTSINTERINVLVDDRYVVVGVDCF
ncbi:hypothetical protein GGH94_006218 [Coemansia aciculifera]|uniref:Uncharacterized protein n=1 Tax=Coemansia aciculifera TaxID=417176 RepID=A0A9W8M343_9FUNG|nr:hypothetical protein GGH94_006218 [Coemansia aciculifera]